MTIITMRIGIASKALVLRGDELLQARTTA